MSGAVFPAAEDAPQDGAAALSLPAGPAFGDAAASGGAGDFVLLDRAAAGDRAAFAVLEERHHVTLAAMVRQRAGARAPVEDLVQETFASALAHLPRFARRSSFLTWTGSIALNLATDWSRRERRRARLAPKAGVGGDEVPGRDLGAAEASAERREEAERARAALERLPAPMRLAVTLRIVEDLPYEEVAARLAAPVPRVRTWVSRGLLRLRRKLEVRDAGE